MKYLVKHLFPHELFSNCTRNKVEFGIGFNVGLIQNFQKWVTMEKSLQLNFFQLSPKYQTQNMFANEIYIFLIYPA